MVDTAGRSATIARMSDDLRRAGDPLSAPEPETPWDRAFRKEFERRRALGWWTAELLLARPLPQARPQPPSRFRRLLRRLHIQRIGEPK